MTVHMPRNASFTFEKIAFKIECIFGNFMVRGTYQLLILRYQNRNRKCAILPILVPSWKMSKIKQISSKPILVSQNKELKLFWFFKPKCTPGHEVSKNTFDFDGDFFKSKSGCSRHVSSIISDNVATHVLNFLKCPFVVPSSSLSKIILHRLHKSTCITCSGPLGNWFLCAFLLEKKPCTKSKKRIRKKSNFSCLHDSWPTVTLLSVVLPCALQDNHYW